MITDEPEVWGIEQVEADHVLIRLAVKTEPLEQWRVARELRARIKAALDDAGIGPGVGVRDHVPRGGRPAATRPVRSAARCHPSCSSSC